MIKKEDRRYLRIISKEKGQFTFVAEGYNSILDTDIPINNEEYIRLYNLRGEGRFFRLKETPTGTGLFDYLEEYTREPEPPAPPTEVEILKEESLEQSEYLVEMDYRLMNLELGL